MALVLADRVEQVTRTTGLADLELAETIRGRQSFEDVTANNDTVYYVLEDADGSAWEIGLGTVVHGTETMLQRTTIRQSSDSDNKISLSAGTHRVFLVADAEWLTERISRADTATTALAGTVEKATTAEAEAGTAGKFPDAAGVHSAFNQYGLGLNSLVGVSSPDADTYLTTGDTAYSTSWVNGPPSAGAAGFLKVEGNTSENTGRSAQKFFDASLGKIFLRVRISGVWQGWQEVYHQDSILGTVSQSGGVPTGAIIESDSNANGVYTKFADGTMICTQTFPESQATTVVGSEYRTGQIIWTYPVAFLVTPEVSGISVRGPTGASGIPYVGGISSNSSSFSFCGLSQISGDYVVPSLTAAGRWY